MADVKIDQKQSPVEPEAHQAVSSNFESIESAISLRMPKMQPFYPEEASSAAILSSEEQDKANEGARACSLIDLETFQKMRLNNLSNRSAHWDPKVFRKIAQLIDPPKSPTETPPGSSNSTRPNSPDAKNLSKFLQSSLS